MSSAWIARLGQTRLCGGVGMMMLVLLVACSNVPMVSSGLPVDIQLVAINDLHGHLEAESKNFRGVDDASAQKRQVGGVATIGGALRAWRAEDPQLLLVGGGDLIGATPPLSAIWADEPTIVALNQLKLRVSAVGNHEFDQGSAEFLRYRDGGCQSVRPDKACKFEPRFAGAKFPYLAANVIDKTTGQPFLLPYRVEEVQGLKIGFIGTVLKETPGIVMASGVAGLEFIDEAAAINRWVPALKAQGVSAIVVLMHQGGSTPEPFDKPECSQLSGPIVDIVTRLDPAIRLVITGHTHQAYTCLVDGRTVTQGGSYGDMLTRITLRIDPRMATLAEKTTHVQARNVLMDTRQFKPDPALADFVQQLKTRSDLILAQPIARLAIPRIERQSNAFGESPLGNVVADAMLASTRVYGAQLAVANQGGLRADLDSGPTGANYAQLAITTPFGNSLILLTLSGTQLVALLEQQNWREQDRTAGRSLLQISDGLRYRWDGRRPKGQRIVPGSLTLDGAVIDPKKAYRLTVSSFMSQGGDGFGVLNQGADRVDTGIVDLDALRQHLIDSERAGTPVGAEAAGRIVRID